MHSVFGFVENLGILRLEHFIGDFERAGGLRDFGVEIVESRQAVEEHEPAVEVARRAHEVHVDLVGTQELDALGRLRLFAHRDPDVGVEHVRAGDALHGVVENADVDAVFRGDGGGLCKNRLVGPELPGRAADVTHARLGATHHQRIGNVVAAVADVCDGAVLKRPERLFNGEKVGENLRGVVVVGQAVPDRDAGVFGEVLARLLRKTAKEDAVVDAAEDARRVLDRFLLAEMDVRAGEVFGAAAFVARGDDG